jgi:hypothetical protein
MTSCPASGKIYARDWERVLVNPTTGTTVTVPLGTTLLLQGAPVTRSRWRRAAAPFS